MSMLKNLPIFKGITEADLEKIEAIVEEKTYEDGTILFRQGDDPNAFYVIKSGAVRIVAHIEGKDKELAVLDAGNFFGEMGVIESAPRSADAVIKGETVLLVFEKNEFHQLMSVNPNLSMKVMSTMARRYRAKAPEKETPGTTEGAIVGVFSATGGVGNSFVTANLATALKALTKKKVIVVDLDLMFGDQAGIFDVKTRNSISLMTGQEEIGFDSLQDCIDSTKSGVDLLQAPQRPEEAETVTPNLILTCLEVLRHHYDYVVCDTANVIQECNLNLFEMVQIPIYVLTPEVLSVKNASRWLSVMEMINFDTHGVKLVLNKYQPHDKATVDYIEGQFRKTIFGIVPLEYEAVKESLNRGRLLVRDDPKSPIGESLRKIAGNVAGIEVEPVTDVPFWRKWIPI